MITLEQLCRPLVRTMCETWSFQRSGAPVEHQKTYRKISAELSDIHEKCENDPVLKREFSRIERPLVFFIDYTIKEGKFPFSRDWRELARNYNELSGDEKFFDMLSENLDDPDASERLMMFYLFMGLGFNGCNEPEFVERRMKLCATRFDRGFDLTRNMLSADDIFEIKHFQNRRKKFCSVYVLLALISFFALCALGYNAYSLHCEIGDFSAAVAEAEEATYAKASQTGAKKNTPPRKSSETATGNLPRKQKGTGHEN